MKSEHWPHKNGSLWREMYSEGEGGGGGLAKVPRDVPQNFGENIYVLSKERSTALAHVEGANHWITST